MADIPVRDHLIWNNTREGFYRPDRAGYTTRIQNAGRYTKAEAEAEARVEPGNIFAVPAPVDPLALPPAAGAE